MGPKRPIPHTPPLLRRSPRHLRGDRPPKRAARVCRAGAQMGKSHLKIDLIQNPRLLFHLSIALPYCHRLPPVMLPFRKKQRPNAIKLEANRHTTKTYLCQR